MAKVTRTLVVLVAFAALILLGARMFFIHTLEDAVARLDAHERQLDEILRIVQSNPNICFVSTDRPIEINCPDARSAHDKRDYANIVALMREIRIDYLSINEPVPTQRPARYMEFEIFDAVAVPFVWVVVSYPIVGVWYEPGNDVMGRKDCHVTRRPNWRACRAGVGWP